MAKQVRSTSKKKSRIWFFPLAKQNFVIMGIGLATIIIGYLLMATGITEEPALVDGTWNNTFAVDVAPILLVVGYCVIIPFGLMKNFNKTEAK